MAKRVAAGKSEAKPTAPARAGRPAVSLSNRPSSLLDTRVVYCGDNLEQLAKLPDACVDLIYINYMRPRCVELARVLKKTGSLYYHCDWHAGGCRSELRAWHTG